MGVCVWVHLGCWCAVLRSSLCLGLYACLFVCVRLFFVLWVCVYACIWSVVGAVWFYVLLWVYLGICVWEYVVRVCVYVLCYSSLYLELCCQEFSYPEFCQSSASDFVVSFVRYPVFLLYPMRCGLERGEFKILLRRVLVEFWPRLSVGGCASLYESM